jgi:predicted DNA repair protein MutK
LHHGVEHLAQMTGVFTSITAALLNGLIGMLAGAMVLAVVMGIGQLKQRVH